MKLKDRFGWYIGRKERHFAPFFVIHRMRYITGHRGVDMNIGNWEVNLIWKIL